MEDGSWWGVFGMAGLTLPPLFVLVISLFELVRDARAGYCRGGPVERLGHGFAVVGAVGWLTVVGWAWLGFPVI
jgi:hypothetical protein